MGSRLIGICFIVPMGGCGVKPLPLTMPPPLPARVRGRCGWKDGSRQTRAKERSALSSGIDGGGRALTIDHGEELDRRVVRAGGRGQRDRRLSGGTSLPAQLSRADGRTRGRGRRGIKSGWSHHATMRRLWSCQAPTDILYTATQLLLLLLLLASARHDLPRSRSTHASCHTWLAHAHQNNSKALRG